MIHLVCECGVLVSATPAPGSRSIPCRACGRSLAVPDPDSLGLPAAASSSAASLAPAPVPLPPVPDLPRFDADERLDLVALEREAARMKAMGWIAAMGGFVGAGAAAVLPGFEAETRVAAGAASLFAAVAGWTLFRGARAACLAAVALAQRQREILRRVA